MNVKQIFSRRLKALRKSAALSQDELAEAIGRNKQTLSHLERGLSFPSAETLDALCKVLNVPAREFFSVTVKDGQLQAIIDQITLKLHDADLKQLENIYTQTSEALKSFKSE